MTSISDTRIAFIGGGNMARSLIGGLVESGTPVGNLLVCEPDDDIRDRLTITSTHWRWTSSCWPSSHR